MCENGSSNPRIEYGMKDGSSGGQRPIPNEVIDWRASVPNETTVNIARVKGRAREIIGTATLWISRSHKVKRDLT